MEIQFEQNGNKGAWYIAQNGERVAAMTFSATGNGTLIIDHTEVSDVLRGTGAGKKMLAAAVEHARAKGLRIMPLCPFAKSVFDKTPDYADVLV